MSAIKEALLHREGKLYEMYRARAIARSLGARIAAFYLKKRGWTVEAAAYIIATTRGVKV